MRYPEPHGCDVGGPDFDAFDLVLAGRLVAAAESIRRRHPAPASSRCSAPVRTSSSSSERAITSAISLTICSSQTRRRSAAVARDGLSAARSATASAGSSMTSTTGRSGVQRRGGPRRLVARQRKRRDQRTRRRLARDRCARCRSPAPRPRRAPESSRRRIATVPRRRAFGAGQRQHRRLAIAEPQDEGRESASQIAIVGDDEHGRQASVMVSSPRSARVAGSRDARKRAAIARRGRIRARVRIPRQPVFSGIRRQTEASWRIRSRTLQR